MSRFEAQLALADPRFAQVLARVPWVETPPLPADWLRCEMLERYQVLGHAPLAGAPRVLEVGSGGHAITTVPLAWRVGGQGQVVAVERERWGFFRDVVGRASLSEAVRPVKADARRLPFPSGAFDLAACVHGVRSLRSEDNMVRVFREMLRVAPRIFLAESLPVAFTAAQRAHLEMYDLRQEYFEAVSGEPDDLHYPSQERLTELLSKAGGKVVSSARLEIDLPHALAYFPRERLLQIGDGRQREDLLSRWDRAEELRRAHGADHPPVGVLVAAPA